MELNFDLYILKYFTFCFFPAGPKSWTWEEVSRVLQGRVSDGASQGGEEVLAQELLSVLPVQ